MNGCLRKIWAPPESILKSSMKNILPNPPLRIFIGKNDWERQESAVTFHDETKIELPEFIFFSFWFIVFFFFFFPFVATPETVVYKEGGYCYGLRPKQALCALMPVTGGGGLVRAWDLGITSSAGLSLKAAAWSWHENWEYRRHVIAGSPSMLDCMETLLDDPQSWAKAPAPAVLRYS